MLIRQAKSWTKIFLIIKYFRFMRQMTTEKLFDDGKYMVIYLYPESVKIVERMFFLWTKEDLQQVKLRKEIKWNSSDK